MEIPALRGAGNLRVLVSAGAVYSAAVRLPDGKAVGHTAAPPISLRSAADRHRQQLCTDHLCGRHRKEKLYPCHQLSLQDRRGKCVPERRCHQRHSRLSAHPDSRGDRRTDHHCDSAVPRHHEIFRSEYVPAMGLHTPAVPQAAGALESGCGVGGGRCAGRRTGRRAGSLPATGAAASDAPQNNSTARPRFSGAACRSTCAGGTAGLLL